MMGPLQNTDTWYKKKPWWMVDDDPMKGYFTLE